MRKYSVHVSYRTHVNSTERTAKTFTVEAPNKDAALVRAGWKLREADAYHMHDSLKVLVTPL